MLKTLKYIAVSIYVVCGGLLVLFTLPQTGWKALSVATGSMAPAITPGSLVLIHRVPNAALHIGDVITFINPRNPKETITHRIVEYHNQGSIPGFITKGDANQSNDQPILGGNVVGKVVWHVPFAGKVLGWAKQPLGLALLVIIPGILIIIEELRRLVVTLSRPENQTTRAESPPVIPSVAEGSLPKRPSSRPEMLRQAQHDKPKKRPSMDGIKHLAIAAAVGVIAIHSTLALVSSKATLTNNTISTATTTNHVVISRVFLGNADGEPACPEFTGDSVTIENTGPGSTNNVVIEHNCNLTITTNNNVAVNNSNNQSSSSGDASNNGNNSGGNAASGDASNSNNTSTSITIANWNKLCRRQWVELHNPTGAKIKLSGWKLRDNSASDDPLPIITIPAHGFVIVPANMMGGKIGDGLDGVGDRLILKNNHGDAIDALSWGTDSSQMSPSIPPIPSGGSVKRINPDFDTDLASDWMVQGP